MNGDTKWIIGIIFFSLVANLGQFIVIMCLWKGCG